MRIISKPRLRAFWETHPDAKVPLSTWYRAVEHADWTKPQDVRDTYRDADPVGGEFVVFNICQNAYRLVVCVDYKQHIVYIYDVLTHRDYDRLDIPALAGREGAGRKRGKKGGGTGT
jgi:mRNA interferase HigB